MPQTFAAADAVELAVVDRSGFIESRHAGIAIVLAPDGTTVTLKMLDGSGRAATAVGLRLLERAGALGSIEVAATMHKLPLSVFGGGQSVGAIRPAF